MYRWAAWSTPAGTFTARAGPAGRDRARLRRVRAPIEAAAAEVPAAHGRIGVAPYWARTPTHGFAELKRSPRAALHLACDKDSSFVTGTTLCADGGWSAMGWIAPSSP
jgi:NAD(P)-dependent dehydrogenase (short-subunit alcohol dehydrogenase family)